MSVESTGQLAIPSQMHLPAYWPLTDHAVDLIVSEQNRRLRESRMPGGKRRYDPPADNA